MAEEEKVDPIAEGKRIARNYFSALIWAREQRRMATGRTMRMTDRDQFLRRADEWETRAEEEFGQAVDKWRHNWSKTAKEVIRTIVEELDKRKDLSFFGRRIIEHCKHDLEKRPVE